MKYKLNNKLGIFSLGVSVAIIVIVAVIAVNSLFQRDKEITTRLIFETLSVEVEKEFDHPLYITKTMENDTFLRDYLEAETELPSQQLSRQMGRYLEAIRAGNEWEGVYFTSAKTLNYYSPQGLVKVLDPRSDPYDQWYYDFIESGRDYALDVEFDQCNNDIWTVFIDKRMEAKDGTLLGVCTVGMRMDELLAQIHRLEKKYEVSIYSTDADGHVQIGSEHIAGTRLFEDQLAEYGRGADIHAYKTRQSYIVSQYVPMLDWYLVVVNDQNLFTGIVSSHIYITFGIGILLLLLILVANLELSAWQNRTLASKADTDPLTGVFNRRGAEKRINIYLMSKHRLRQGGALFLADMDNFKRVNDTLGHGKGDEVLVEAAKLLSSSFRNNDIVCRLGGDEFLVFCPGMTNMDTIVKKAEELLLGCRRTVRNGDKEVESGMSIGIAVYPQHGTVLEELTEKADKALYAAKDAGRCSYRVFGGL